ncbi:MAG: hypothetical protein M1814_001589 [Vezdaea aestivalis]|nr:MAG: hypothetical protein M1814_001589 [Vezdaea aestivalis]
MPRGQLEKSTSASVAIDRMAQKVKELDLLADFTETEFDRIQNAEALVSGSSAQLTTGYRGKRYQAFLRSLDRNVGRGMVFLCAFVLGENVISRMKKPELSALLDKIRTQAPAWDSGALTRIEKLMDASKRRRSQLAAPID